MNGVTNNVKKAIHKDMFLFYPATPTTHPYDSIHNSNYALKAQIAQQQISFAASSASAEPPGTPGWSPIYSQPKAVGRRH